MRASIALVLAGGLGSLTCLSLSNASMGSGVFAAQAPADARAALAAGHAATDWPTYLGDNARTHYSLLGQITRSNVGMLKTAWTYDTGDRGEFQANPLIVNGVLYICTATRKVVALNAATGAEMWKFDPTSERPGGTGTRQRGVTYWADGADRRIFTGAGPYLYALNADTGQVVRSFGTNGSILLGTGAELEPGGTPTTVTLNTPGLIYKDMFIVAGITNGPGSVRAFDVRTGVLRWIFHTIPRPGEFGYETWPPEAYKTIGAASNWSGSALDDARGIVYVPTETATPDFWGADRPGANLFANTLLALDANTGRRLWHFQIVHHDLLDKDLPTPPVLATVTHNGRRVDVVAQGTKHGLLFVFNRVTGEPLWPIEERPIPQGDLPGVSTSPTQPYPTKPPPLMRQTYTQDDVSNISRQATLLTSARFKQGGSHGAFPGPSLKESIIFPGFDGGMEWGGAAADPDGIYYANLNEIPWLYKMIPTRRPDGTPFSLGERTYIIQCGSCHGLDQRGDAASGFPAIVDIREKRTQAQVTEVVEKGIGRMPPFAQIQEGQRRAMVDFLFGVEQPPAAYAAPGRGGGGGGGGGPAADAPPYAFAGFRR